MKIKPFIILSIFLSVSVQAQITNVALGTAPTGAGGDVARAAFIKLNNNDNFLLSYSQAVSNFFKTNVTGNVSSVSNFFLSYIATNSTAGAQPVPSIVHLNDEQTSYTATNGEGVIVWSQSCCDVDLYLPDAARHPITVIMQTNSLSRTLRIHPSSGQHIDGVVDGVLTNYGVAGMAYTLQHATNTSPHGWTLVGKSFKAEIDAGGFAVRNVAEPVAGDDAATKGYVDSFVGYGGGIDTATITNLTVDNITVGGGDAITKIIKVDVTFDWPSSIAAGETEGNLVSVPGAELGDAIFVTAHKDAHSSSSLVVSGYVIGTDNVVIHLSNVSTVAYNPPSATYRIVVIKF